ncbi:MAG: DUF2240 family protein [Thermoplasmataceae archaeon]
MDREIARKLIAMVAAEKKNSTSYLEKDFINILSYKRKLLSEEEAGKFIQQCKEIGIVTEVNGKYQPNFNASGVIVPIDFAFTSIELFEEVNEANFMDRLLETISGSGKMSKKEGLNRMQEHLKELKFIDNEERIMSIMIDASISIDDFKGDIKERYFEPTKINDN